MYPAQFKILNDSYPINTTMVKSLGLQAKMLFKKIAWNSPFKSYAINLDLIKKHFAYAQSPQCAYNRWKTKTGKLLACFPNAFPSTTNLFLLQYSADLLCLLLFPTIPICIRCSIIQMHMYSCSPECIHTSCYLTSH